VPKHFLTKKKRSNEKQKKIKISNWDKKTLTGNKINKPAGLFFFFFFWAAM